MPKWFTLTKHVVAVLPFLHFALSVNYEHLVFHLSSFTDILQEMGKKKFFTTSQFLFSGFDRQIPGYQGRYSIIGNDRTEYNLQILNTILDDDDDFQCQVGPADNNPPLIAKAHLTVLGKRIVFLF